MMRVCQWCTPAVCPLTCLCWHCHRSVSTGAPQPHHTMQVSTSSRYSARCRWCMVLWCTQAARCSIKATPPSLLHSRYPSDFLDFFLGWISLSAPALLRQQSRRWCEDDSCWQVLASAATTPPPSHVLQSPSPNENSRCSKFAELQNTRTRTCTDGGSNQARQ